MLAPNVESLEMDKMVREQSLTFDGYMRMEILSNLSHDASKIMTNDVLVLCHKFYLLNIESLKWFRAARMGKIETIKSILDNMAFRIDMIDNDDNMTALMLACANGHNKLVQYLLQRGADVNHRGYNGYTALMFAVENGKVLIFSELIENEDTLIGMKGDDGTTILMCAAKGQMPAVVNVALCEDVDVDIDAQNSDGNTALMIACQYDSVMVAQELLRNYCDFDIKNTSNQNALILCAKYGSAQIAAMLCIMGAEIDEEDNEGKTALMYAAMNGYKGIVVTLIKYGADINIVDKQGLNALEYANKYGRLEIVKMIKSDQGQDMSDVLQQMEILKQKNKALAKNVQQLMHINEELSDELNALKTKFNIKGKVGFPKINVNFRDRFSGMMNKLNRRFSDSNKMIPTKANNSPLRNPKSKE